MTQGIKSFVLIICISSSFLYSRLSAQVDSTLKDFCSLKIGNTFQYLEHDPSGTAYTRTCTIVADTLMPNGMRYSFGCHPIRIDSQYRVQLYRPYLGDTCGGAAQELNIYRLNEPVGTFWPLCEDIATTLSSKCFMRYSGSDTVLLFGRVRRIMHFSPGAFFPEAGDTIWLSIDWSLAEGFGIFHEETMEGVDRTLVGALIDGVRYGTMADVKENSSQIPHVVRLYQNHPNPFNPSTTLEYDLAAEAHVLLKIYDLLGREVATVVDREQEAGYKSVQFNDSNLPSGIYFYRLQAGSYTAVKKMLLMK